MTRHDFYQLALESLLPRVPNHWAEYRAGAITHFEALQRYFAAIRADEAAVLAVVDRMELDPHLPDAVAALRTAGWDVVVTSAGCDWYIRRLLGAVGVAVPVYANPGRFEPGRGLLMDRPEGEWYFSPTIGVDKAGVVRTHVAAGRAVAFAGDGFPDAEAALLVPPERRFARGDLADTLDCDGLPYRPFAAWSDVARGLLGTEG